MKFPTRVLKMVLIVLLPIIGCCQETKNDKKIQLIFSESDIVIGANQSQIELGISLANNTNQSFILYRFKEIEDAISDERFYTNDNDISVGNALFLIDDIGKRCKIGIVNPRSIEHYKPFTADSLSKSLKDSRDSFLNNKLLIGSNKTVNLVLSAQINTKLKKGIYSAYLIYYSGKNIVNLVSVDRINSDQKENDAILFQGYVKSNIIKIIINE